RPVMLRAYVQLALKLLASTLMVVSTILLAMRREYEPELGQSAYNELIGSARKIVETTISVLARSFNANWTYARSITGLVTNLVIKMTAFTLGNYLNRLMGEPVLQVTSIVN